MRTCDGYYFPISYATVPNRFADDERSCRRMCPASEAVLYTHRNPGEDVSQAVSSSGQRYADLPVAFAYRHALNKACTCKPAGTSWAQALTRNGDETLQRGDIVVTDDKSKALQPPQQRQPRADGRARGRSAAPPANLRGSAAAAPSPPAREAPERPPAAAAPRTVGPQYLPAR